MTKIEKALQYLNSLVEVGAEFPDALFATTKKFKVKHSDLTLAYDEQFV